IVVGGVVDEVEVAIKNCKATRHTAAESSSAHVERCRTLHPPPVRHKGVDNFRVEWYASIMRPIACLGVRGDRGSLCPTYQDPKRSSFNTSVCTNIDRPRRNVQSSICQWL